MKYLYNLAGLRLLFDIPYELHIGPESAPFLAPWPGGEADWTFPVEPVEALPPVPGDAHREVCRHYAGDRMWLFAAPGEKPYAATVRQEHRRETVCRYLRGREDYVNYSRNLCELMDAETLLLLFQGLLLHASFIRFEGSGILFTAPSGTGKSTQAELWARYRDADILNGDRAALRHTQTGWQVWGLPFAGSSGIYRSETAPLKAIVVLTQAKENRLSRLTGREALCRLLPETTLHFWDSRFVDSAMDLMTALLQQVPVYRLDCLPDADAVTLLHQTLFQEETT